MPKATWLYVPNGFTPGVWVYPSIIRSSGGTNWNQSSIFSDTEIVPASTPFTLLATVSDNQKASMIGFCLASEISTIYNSGGSASLNTHVAMSRVINSSSVRQYFKNSLTSDSLASPWVLKISRDGSNVFQYFINDEEQVHNDAPVSDSSALYLYSLLGSSTTGFESISVDIGDAGGTGVWSSSNRGTNVTVL